MKRKCNRWIWCQMEINLIWTQNQQAMHNIYKCNKTWPRFDSIYYWPCWAVSNTVQCCSNTGVGIPFTHLLKILSRDNSVQIDFETINVQATIPRTKLNGQNWIRSNGDQVGLCWPNVWPILAKASCVCVNIIAAQVQMRLRWSPAKKATRPLLLSVREREIENSNNNKRKNQTIIQFNSNVYSFFYFLRSWCFYFCWLAFKSGCCSTNNGQINIIYAFWKDKVPLHAGCA